MACPPSTEPPAVLGPRSNRTCCLATSLASCAATAASPSATTAEQLPTTWRLSSSRRSMRVERLQTDQKVQDW